MTGVSDGSTMMICGTFVGISVAGSTTTTGVSDGTVVADATVVAATSGVSEGMSVAVGGSVGGGSSLTGINNCCVSKMRASEPSWLAIMIASTVLLKRVANCPTV